jgi:AAHS family 4-hydroxybenzoate transporter-like MFS transporter
LTYGIATSLVDLSSNLLMFSILRFIAGVGIGGALPSGTTMTAEFTPARIRTIAITATIVCVPLGGMLAGLFAGQILPAFGWRGLFLAGGLPPIVLTPILYLLLPESPRFLAHHQRRWPELGRLLGRMSRKVPADAVFRDSREPNLDERAGIAAVFAPALVRDTIAIGCVFFMSLLAIYSVFNWLPTMLAAEGLTAAAAGGGLTAYNVGGVFGALVCALAIKRYGSRWPLALCAAGGCASALLLRSVNVSEHPQLLTLGLVAHGLCANAVQSVMYAVCAHVYPTNVRATGTALGLTVGRV